MCPLCKSRKRTLVCKKCATGSWVWLSITVFPSPPKVVNTKNLLVPQKLWFLSRWIKCHQFSLDFCSWNISTSEVGVQPDDSIELTSCAWVQEEGISWGFQGNDVHSVLWSESLHRMSFYLGASLYLILRGSLGPTIEDAARPPWPTSVCLLQRRVDRKKHTSQRNSWFKQRLNVNTHTYIRIFLDLSNVSKQVFVTCCLPQTRRLRKVNVSSIKLLINDIWGIDRFIVWSCPRVVEHSHLENKADLERRIFF